MSIAVRNFDSKAELLTAMESLMRETLIQTSENRFALMISGGNTPLPVYNAIAADPVAASPNACIMFADDRHVPVDSPENNYGNARAMIDALGLKPGNILRIYPEFSLEESADRYDIDLRTFLKSGGAIPVALLGLGADGHTCSLFNDDDLARCAGRLAAPAYKSSPPDRVTVSPELLSRCDRVIFVAAGDDKRAMIQALIEAPDSITAGKAVAGCKSVEIWRA